MTVFCCSDNAIISYAKLMSFKLDLPNEIQQFLNKYGIANTRVQMSTGEMLVIENFHEKMLNKWKVKLVIPGTDEEASITCDADLPGKNNSFMNQR